MFWSSINHSGSISKLLLLQPGSYVVFTKLCLLLIYVDLLCTCHSHKQKVAQITQLSLTKLTLPKQ